MKSPEELKQIVKDKYSEIVEKNKSEATSCCGTISCCDSDVSNFSDDYSKLKGYNSDADLALGCGIPTESIDIKEGNTVVDLGSGAGNDVFVARSLVGKTGKVIGIDMTKAMIDKANKNNEKLGYDNVEFKFGEIEKMPLENETADVVISNCVLNLVPDKQKAFDEIYRILKPGALFSISDIVLVGELPEKIKDIATLYAGCVAGALQKDDYLQMINEAGFEDVNVMKDKNIEVPEDILRTELSEEEIKSYNDSKTIIKSITVKGKKPN